MTKEELAKAYAEENSTDYKNALQAAFEKGFEAGVESTKERQVIEEGIEYIDLGLPSGTLWSKKTYNYKSFPDANLMNIPTQEDWTEIVEFCKVSSLISSGDIYRFFIKGLNGEVVETLGCVNTHTWYFIPDCAKQRNIPAIDLLSILRKERSSLVSEVFSGEKLPIFLVKKK